MKRIGIALGICLSFSAASALAESGVTAGAAFCIETIPFSTANISAFLNCLNAFAAAQTSTTSTQPAATPSSDSSSSAPASNQVQLSSSVLQQNTATAAADPTQMLARLASQASFFQRDIAQRQQDFASAQMLAALEPGNAAVAQTAMAQAAQMIAADQQQLQQIQALALSVMGQSQTQTQTTTTPDATALAQLLAQIQASQTGSVSY